MEFSIHSAYDNNYIRRFEQIISTQNDNSNSSINSGLSLGSKKKRASLSAEQREMINSKRRVSALSGEQRERRNSKRRIESISAEQRERINSKRRVSSLTAEQRERRNCKRRVSSLTSEQREQRNQKRRISSMSSEQRAVVNLKRRRNTSPHSGSTKNGQMSMQVQPHMQQQMHSQQQSNQHGAQHQQQPFITTVHLDSRKKSQSDAQYGSTLVMTDPNQLGSYGNLFRQSKMVQYTPQEMELINSIRNGATIININRRC